MDSREPRRRDPKQDLSAPLPGGEIDASPGGDESYLDANARPRSIQDTKAWKDGSKEIKRGWSSYVGMLSRTFKNMSRFEQEQLISQFCMIVTMGVSALLTMFFYPFLPLYVRVVVVPLILVGAWWVGTRVVAPIVIVRCEQHLNSES